VAKYIFECGSCKKKESKFVPVKTTELPCECGGTQYRKLPNIATQTVNETVDTFTNTKRSQNHDADIKQRRDDHYWTVDVPRFIQTYSTETCLEQQWLIYNEKGELVINKPPSKR